VLYAGLSAAAKNCAHRTPQKRHTE